MTSRSFVLTALACAFALAPIPAAAQDRWQVTLHNGTIVWDLELVKLAGDTVVFRQTDADSLVRLPVMGVDELRLVQKSEKRQFAPDGQGTENGLTGGADVVWLFTLLSRDERLNILRRILADSQSGAGTDP